MSGRPDQVFEADRTWATDEVLASDFENLGEGPVEALDRTTLLGMSDFLAHRQATSRKTDLLLLVRNDGVVLAGSLPRDHPGLAGMIGQPVAALLGPEGAAEAAWIERALKPPGDPDRLVTLGGGTPREAEAAR